MRLHRRFAFTFALRSAAVVLIAFSGAAGVSAQPVGLEEIGGAIHHGIAAWQVPSVSVAVSRAGTIVWEEAFGLAERERKIPATIHTPYYIASVTKSITATALMMQYERGVLRLDDPVNRYLGSSGVHSPLWNAEEATIRRVATHTSGLTTFTRWCVAGDGCRVSLPDEIRRYGILFWPPGEVFDYSNLGYGILGEVISQTTGGRLDDYVQRAVFRPLGMRDCYIEPSSAAVASPAAQYDERTHKRSPHANSSHPGASGGYCSVHDLVLFGMAHLKDHLPSQRAVLADATIDAMHQPETSTHGQYGLGWWIKDVSGYRIVFAQGGTNNAYALLYLVPAADVAVAVLANSFNSSITTIGDDILAALLPGFVTPSPAAAPGAVTKAAPVRLVGKWTGRIDSYRGPVPITMNIDPSGDVRVALRRRPPSRLAVATLRDNHLYGRLKSDVRLPDSASASSVLELDLFVRGDKLAGAATSGPAPGMDGDQLPHWVELRRVGRSGRTEPR